MFSTYSGGIVRLGLQGDARSADAGAMRPVLTLTCPRCRAWFPSSLQLDPRAFEQIDLTHMLEKCRGCGIVSRYEKRDYHFEVPSDVDSN